MRSDAILQYFEASGFDIKEAPKPGGSYVSVNIRANIAYVAIQFPIRSNARLFTGRLGQELKTADGYEAAKLAAENVLRQIHQYVGFERIIGLNHMDLYYQADGDWDEGRIVADGASDLFLNVLGEGGVHSRAIFGVHQLPRNFCVGITTSFTLED